jgi:DNA-directed RNA polymerase I and III subunit RPAC2
MPAMTDDPSRVHTTNPTSASDEIDLSIDKNRIRKVNQPLKRFLKEGNVLMISSQLDGSTDTAASFQIDGEDHTLGNALRYVIMKKYVFVIARGFLVETTTNTNVQSRR